MKKTILCVLLALAASLASRAQTAPEGFVLVDSLIYVPVPPMDSTLNGKTIWSSLPEGVRVFQDGSVRSALDAQTARNASKNVTGYRIRIFFDNRQTARYDSEAAVNRFKALHPGTAAYRSFSNPFFKVTVGDYRTKSEALAALKEIKPDFPTAFIVKEKFKYPAINNDQAFRTDTVRILRPAATYGQ